MAVLVDRFSRWVESVELVPASPRYDALRGAAEAIGAGLDGAGAIDLVTYAVGGESEQAFATVTAAVAARDPSFSARAPDLEPHLVASAALARALEDDTLTAAIIAGAVRCAEFVRLYSPVLELPQLAAAAQARRYRSLRERAAIPAIELESIFDELPNFAIDGWRGPEGVDRLAEATRTLAERVQNALTKLGARFEARLDAADEELDVLWWAFSAHGEGSGSGWNGSYSPDVLLQAGVELADRHRFLAEIPTSPEILRRALGPRGEEEYVLAEVIAAAAQTVQLDAAAVAGPLFPILTSTAACLALEGNGEWVAAAGRLGVDATMTRRGHEIAAQAARELLLVRALGE
jgi:hypothetical protein